MRIKFQQRCAKCRKNMVPMTSSRQFPICAPCQLKEIDQPITSAAMRRFFAIPHELYVQSSFLRSIKSQYLRFGSLTPNQRDAFKKVVEELQNPTIQQQREAKKLLAEQKATPKQRLLDALDGILKKDTKDKRRKALEVIADLELSGITDPAIQSAVNALVLKLRGRAKILLMTPDEIKQVRDTLGAT
ncbi:MAG TPA: hypothetical protein VLJ21_01800 [Candidatus Binatia bacterium]|nr:hypothetical protein [Candidatus Binatia bacterium]